MNESMPYVEACHHTYGGEYGQGAGPGENIPAWLVFDQQYRDRYIFAGLNPGQRIPRKWLESGVIVAADTLEERAAKTGLPAEAPTATGDATWSPREAVTATSSQLPATSTMPERFSVTATLSP